MPAATTSLSPIAASAFGPEQARHLLQRAGFGASPAEIREFVGLGLDAAVQRLVRYTFDASSLPAPDVDPDVIQPIGDDLRRAMRQAKRDGDAEAREALLKERLRRQGEDREMHRGLQAWWLETMLDTDQPTREKLTLLWHGHFATRHKSVKDAYLLYRQNMLFRGHARRFDELAHGIVRDPAMLIFLDNHRNNRRSPNENLSRELMELFTLGEGRYGERDIQEGARALTGYHVDDNEFAFRKALHDGGGKTILGKTGDFDGDDFVALLLARKQCAEHVALKLYRHFVADVADTVQQVSGPGRMVIERLATMIAGRDYDLAPVLETLFKSEHFHDPAIVGQMIKSPVQLVVGTVRTLATPSREPMPLVNAMGAMGQELFDPPSVAGWDGGRSWINTSTLFIRQNTCAHLITGKDPRRDNWATARSDYDPQPFFAAMSPEQRGSAAGVVDYAVDALLGAHTPRERREPLVRFLRDRGPKATTDDALVALLLLVTAMPDYQLH